ncbi:hypothetical protein E2562_000272, partial [Oryza meyeriana var. granulata]
CGAIVAVISLFNFRCDATVYFIYKYAGDWDFQHRQFLLFWACSIQYPTISLKRICRWFR